MFAPPPSSPVVAQGAKKNASSVPPARAAKEEEPEEVKLRVLKEQLAKFVAAQDYRKAADLQDEIKVEEAKVAEVRAVREELKKAVQLQDYRKAADLQDQIKAMLGGAEKEVEQEKVVAPASTTTSRSAGEGGSKNLSHVADPLRKAREFRKMRRGEDDQGLSKEGAAAEVPPPPKGDAMMPPASVAERVATQAVSPPEPEQQYYNHLISAAAKPGTLKMKEDDLPSLEAAENHFHRRTTRRAAAKRDQEQQKSDSPKSNYWWGSDKRMVAKLEQRMDAARRSAAGGRSSSSGSRGGGATPPPTTPSRIMPRSLNRAMVAADKVPKAGDSVDDWAEAWETSQSAKAAIIANAERSHDHHGNVVAEAAAAIYDTALPKATQSIAALPKATQSIAEAWAWETSQNVPAMVAKAADSRGRGQPNVVAEAAAAIDDKAAVPKTQSTTAATKLSGVRELALEAEEDVIARRLSLLQSGVLEKNDEDN